MTGSLRALSRSLLCASMVVAVGRMAWSENPSFDVNDVSILWPAPKTPADVASLLSADDPLADGSTLWPKDVFDHAMTAARTVKVTASSGTSFQIAFADPKFLSPHTWKVVGIRVDPSAPGTEPAVAALFGTYPQVRLVLQPVTESGGRIRVHDVAAHVVYSYITALEPFPASPVQVRAIPDKVAFRRVLDDLNSLKTLCTAAGAPTKGELSIHPAIVRRVAGFQDRLKLLLRTHLTRARLQAISFMGIDEPEPWIFFSMRVPRKTDPLLPPAQEEMLIFRGGDPVVTRQRNSQFGVGMGVSTATLFAEGISDRVEHRALPDATTPEIQNIKLAHVADIVANPRRSHFFNTNCVSCHSESTRRNALRLAPAPSSLSYQRPTGISGVAATLIPTDQWNVHNFGWFPDSGGVVETVSQRTANEAADSVDFINREYFGQASTTTAVPPSLPPAPLPAPLAMKATPLTLMMDIKSPQDFGALKALLDAIQSSPPDRNPIRVALDKLGLVHFARFFFVGEEKLAVVTSYDGSFDDYISAFVRDIGEVFDKLLDHVKDAPPLPVSEHPAAFLAYVKSHDLKCIPPFYSAYPDLSTQEILTLRNRSRP